LKRLGCFDALLAGYFSVNATSPYVEELSRDFLRSLRLHDDSLVRAVSQFELASLQTKAASDEVFEILWDRDPDCVLSALQNECELRAAEEKGLYRAYVDRSLSGGLTCSRSGGRRRAPDTASGGAIFDEA
jgi:hypothetical protein